MVESNKTAQGWTKWLGGAVLLLLSVDYFPSLPGASLDSSWMNGIAAALAQGAVPGRDLLFTYGPLAAMNTAYWGPGFMLGLLLSLLIALNLAVLMRGVFGTKFLTAAVLIFLVCPSNEALFYLYLAIIPLALVRWVQEGTAGELAQGVALGAALLLAPALTLSKLSFAPLSALLLLVSCLYLVTAGLWRTAATALVSALAALVLWWLVAGQQLTDLPSYLLDGEIIKGYTVAMEWDLGVAIRGVNLQLVESLLLYVCAALLLLLLLYREAEAKQRIYLLLALGAVAAVVIKAGVARHGGVHSIFPWVVLALWALLAREGLGRDRLANAVLGLSLTVMVLTSPIYSGDGSGLGRVAMTAKSHALKHGIDWQTQKRAPGFWLRYIGTAPMVALGSLPAPLAGLAERWDNLAGLGHAIGGRSLSETLAKVDREIQAQCRMPSFKGSADIYPTDINCLLATGAQWAPRPVFQSYSAYTPALLEVNRRHVAGPQAPEHLFFDVKPIDERLPALEEGYAWACIADRYRPVDEAVSPWLHLRRTGSRQCADYVQTATLAARLGEPVKLSCDRSRTLVSFDFVPTLAGRLTSLVYKTRRLSITVDTCDGSSHVYRFVPSMAALPFPLSPLVDDATSLRTLLETGGGDAGRRIESFVIDYADSESPVRGWSTDYRVRLHDLSAAQSPAGVAATSSVK